MPENDKVPGPLPTATAGINALVFVALCLVKPRQLLTTVPGTAGKRYFDDLPTGLGLLLFPVILGLLAPTLGAPRGQEGFGGILLFWLLLIAARLLHVVRGAWRRKRGYSVHTRYQGNSPLPGWMTLTFNDPPSHKLKTDQLLGMAWGIGIGLLTHSVPVIAWGVLGVFACYVPAAYFEAQDQARLDAAEDARHDARWMASELRKRDATRWN